MLGKAAGCSALLQMQIQLFNTRGANSLRGPARGSQSLGRVLWAGEVTVAPLVGGSVQEVWLPLCCYIVSLLELRASLLGGSTLFMLAMSKKLAGLLHLGTLERPLQPLPTPLWRIRLEREVYETVLE